MKLKTFSNTVVSKVFKEFEKTFKKHQKEPTSKDICIEQKFKLIKDVYKFSIIFTTNTLKEKVIKAKLQIQYENGFRELTWDTIDCMFFFEKDKYYYSRDNTKFVLKVIQEMSYKALELEVRRYENFLSNFHLIK